MARKKVRTSTDVSEDRLDRALAALIANTHTTKRKLPIPEIATWLGIAVSELGSLDEVAARIDLTPKMLRQFLAVKELSPGVQDLFRAREIDSVDMVAHLRLLEKSDQVYVAKQAAKKELNSADVRAVREFRRDNPKVPIKEVVERVKASRNIRQYVLEFVVRGGRPNKTKTIARLRKFFDQDEVVSFELDGSIATLVLDQNGRTRLMKKAKELGLNVKSAVNKLVIGEI